MDFPKIIEPLSSSIVGTAQVRLNRRTGGQLMLRGRVILGNNAATTDGSHSQPLKEVPQLRWTLQLPGIPYIVLIH